jgi:nucleoside-diphosphate-sugar epimerase
VAMRMFVTGEAGSLAPISAAGSWRMAMTSSGWAISPMDLWRTWQAPELRLLEGDLPNDALIGKAATDCGEILNHAAVRSVPQSIEQPARTTDVNVRGTLNVLLASA